MPRLAAPGPRRALTNARAALDVTQERIGEFETVGRDAESEPHRRDERSQTAETLLQNVVAMFGGVT